jgi:CRISPR/Cas system-associated exonuclease Cas4 (RecB family)
MASLDLPAVQSAPSTGRDYLSFSAIRLFQTCPLKFFYKYVMGLPEETVSSSLILGAAVHRGIEFHFRELLSGNPPPSSDALLAEFWEGWKERDLEQVRFGKGEDRESLGLLAERILTAFQQSGAAQPRGQILAVEEELRGPVVAGCPDILGRVDLIVDAGDSLVVSDWKTARSRWSHEQAEDAAEQLILYAELAKDFAPGKPLKLEFVILTKTKEAVVDRHVMPVDPMQVDRTKRVVERVWHAIESGNFYPAPSAMNCPGCPYREQCRSWSG